MIHPDLPGSAAVPVDATSPARRRLLYAGVAGVAALGGAGLGWWRWQPHAVESGAEQALWRMEFDRPNGTRLALRSFAGRPLLLNFWATWCPPCVQELPMLDAFHRQHAGQGWQVVGLALDQPAAVRRFLQHTPLDFPVGLAGQGGTGLGRALGNTTSALPFSVLLGSAGRVRQRKLGPLTSQELRQWSDLR